MVCRAAHAAGGKIGRTHPTRAGAIPNVFLPTESEAAARLEKQRGRGEGGYLLLGVHGGGGGGGRDEVAPALWGEGDDRGGGRRRGEKWASGEKGERNRKGLGCRVGHASVASAPTYRFARAQGSNPGQASNATTPHQQSTSTVRGGCFLVSPTRGPVC